MAKKSILATIMGVESGGRNIPQAIHDINTEKGTPAQGYFQIVNPTWSTYGGDKTGFKSAIDAPYQTQVQVALNIPVNQWGPATIAALKAAGYEPQGDETLGQMLARHNEDPTATRPEDAGGSSSGGGTATASTPVSPELQGLLSSNAQLNKQLADLQAKQDEAAKEKEKSVWGDVEGFGAGLLKQGAAQPAQLPPMLQAKAHIPQAPDFAQMALEQRQQQQPDFMQMLAQQRLQRRMV